MCLGAGDTYRSLGFFISSCTLSVSVQLTLYTTLIWARGPPCIITGLDSRDLSTQPASLPRMGFPFLAKLVPLILTLQSDVGRCAAQKGFGSLSKSSALGLRDGEIRNPKSLPTFPPGFKEGRGNFLAFKGTGKKGFSSLCCASSTGILQKTKTAKRLSALQSRSWFKSCFCHFLEQRSANCSCKGPDDTYFRFCRPSGLSHS